VIGYSDFHAVDAKQAAERLGWRVPDRLSVTGFDDLDFAAWPEFSLTTVDQPKAELGAAAVRMVFDQIRGRRKTSPLRFPPKLVVRASTAPPPGRG
jgi:LacI family repressor for deo operon, udp, cdd, tsx, nupC, and nupG